ncbi:MAG: hypothetical protein FJW30_12375 [Acidobacteria bacterium]|nr:hypothetical protein [Acidobacteriota bacterium]
MKLLILLGATSAWASIIGISVANTSNADSSSSSAQRVIEFRTANIGTSAVSQSGNTFSFSNHFAWMAGYQVPAGGATVGNALSTHVGFELTFTVEDPGSAGYSLQFDQLTRGYNTALYETGASTVFASSGTMAYYLNSGSGFVQIPTLFSFGNQATAGSGNPNVNVLLNSIDSESGGIFSGTRTFTLRVETRPSPNVILALQNNVTGSAASRFGMEGLLGIPAAATPGADTEPASALGNFVTVSVTMNGGSAEVPEPSTFALSAAALWATSRLRNRLRRRIA